MKKIVTLVAATALATVAAMNLARAEATPDDVALGSATMAVAHHNCAGFTLDVTKLTAMTVASMQSYGITSESVMTVIIRNAVGQARLAYSIDPDGFCSRVKTEARKLDPKFRDAIGVQVDG